MSTNDQRRSAESSAQSLHRTGPTQASLLFESFDCLASCCQVLCASNCTRQNTHAFIPSQGSFHADGYKSCYYTEQQVTDLLPVKGAQCVAEQGSHGCRKKGALGIKGAVDCGTATAGAGESVVAATTTATGAAPAAATPAA